MKKNKNLFNSRRRKKEVVAYTHEISEDKKTITIYLTDGIVQKIKSERSRSKMGVSKTYELMLDSIVFCYSKYKDATIKVEGLSNEETRELQCG